MSARKYSPSKNNRMTAGFTLIELMVVSTITVLLLLSVSSMMMTFMLSNARTNIRRQIKAEGNEMISQLEFAFRNAKVLTSSPTSTNVAVNCTPAGGETSLVNGSKIVIEDLEEPFAELSFVEAGGEKYMAIDGRRINSNFVIADLPKVYCTKHGGTGKTSVKIEFVLSRTGESAMNETFNSVVQLRNS